MFGMTTPQLIWNLIILIIVLYVLYRVYKYFTSPSTKMAVGTAMKQRQQGKADEAYLAAKTALLGVQRRIKQWQTDNALLEQNLVTANSENNPTRVQALATEIGRRKNLVQGDIRLEQRLLEQIQKLAAVRTDLKDEVDQLQTESAGMRAQQTGNEALRAVYQSMAGLDASSGDALVNSARQQFQSEQDQIDVLFEMADEAQSNSGQSDLYRPSPGDTSANETIIAEVLAKHNAAPAN